MIGNRDQLRSLRDGSNHRMKSRHVRLHPITEARRLLRVPAYDHRVPLHLLPKRVGHHTTGFIYGLAPPGGRCYYGAFDGSGWHQETAFGVFSAYRYRAHYAGGYAGYSDGRFGVADKMFFVERAAWFPPAFQVLQRGARDVLHPFTTSVAPVLAVVIPEIQIK